jgi:glycosyltransferase involved in cell wall biosynthesis
MIISTVFFTMAYNARHTIHRTIESILKQTRGDFQYYILDNGSTDNTEAIILNYAKKDNRIVLLRVNNNHITNGGPFCKAIAHATSAKYIAWCDADDEYTPDFLENMIRFSEENQLDIASCGYEKIDGLTGDVVKH